MTTGRADIGQSDDRIVVRRVLILANPVARGYAPARLEKLAAVLAEGGVDVEIRRSEKRGDIRAMIEAVGGRFDVIAVHGGDGTLNEAVAGLRLMTDPPALAIIAGGTANVLARETGAASAPDEIARNIIAGRTAALHYGLANGAPFVLMASAGLDAAVVHGISPRLKRALGKGAYLAAAFAQTFRARSPDVIVRANGRELTCRIAIAANAARYGGDFILAPGASALKPGLQLVLVTDDSLFALLRIGWLLSLGRDPARAGMMRVAADEAEILAAAEVAAQADGDAFGVTPLRVAAAPGAVRVVVG